MTDSDDNPQHLGRNEGWIHWDWSRENPVEIVLVVFVLVLFFMLPRTGCMIEKKDGSMSPSMVTDRARNAGG